MEHEVVKTETVVIRYDSQGRVIDKTTTIVENGVKQDEKVLIGQYL
jgi:hypothetical protein